MSRAAIETGERGDAARQLIPENKAQRFHPGACPRDAIRACIARNRFSPRPSRAATSCATRTPCRSGAELLRQLGFCIGTRPVVQFVTPIFPCPCRRGRAHGRRADTSKAGREEIRSWPVSGSRAPSAASRRLWRARLEFPDDVGCRFARESRDTMSASGSDRA